MTTPAKGIKIGRLRCPASTCQKPVNITITSGGKSQLRCPHANEQTLERCGTVTYYGKSETRQLINLFEAEKSKPKAEPNERPRRTERPKPAGQPASDKPILDEDGFFV